MKTFTSETHPPRFIHSIASLNMSLLKMSLMRLCVASSRVQGRAFFATWAGLPSTQSTCNVQEKVQGDSAKAHTECQKSKILETQLKNLYYYYLFIFRDFAFHTVILTI